jgi:hypothetical protein
MDGRGHRGGSVAIIGMACRFPGARDTAEFHDLAVAGRDMFQPVAALPGRPLRAAVLDDWSAPQIADNPVTGGLWPDAGPVRKLTAEMTALALTDAGLREVAGTCRTGLIIASSVPELGEQVREEFGFPPRGLVSRSAHVSSPHAVVAAAGALQTGQLDLAVAGGAELGLDPVWLALQDRPHGAALTQALAALFTAGALTDLTPFLPAAGAAEERRARDGGTRGGREISGSTLASRTVPRMRAAEEADRPGPAPAGAVRCGGAGYPARSVP